MKNNSAGSKTSLRRLTFWAGFWGSLILVFVLFIIWINRLYLSATTPLIIFGVVLLVVMLLLLLQKPNRVQAKKHNTMVKLQTWVEGISIMGITIIVLLALAETGARLYTSTYIDKPMNPILEDGSYALMHIPAYKDASYVSNTFFDENTNLNSGESGIYINVENGFRVTKGQPQFYQNRVWVFGGSTIVCAEVPDWLTIPSLLQAKFNQVYGSQYLVENRGAKAGLILDQLDFLKQEDIKPGDIVIFYDGYNDLRVTQSFESRKLKSFWEHFTFFRMFIRPLFGRGLPGSYQRAADIAYDNVMRYIPEAADWVTAHGGTFIHFLQPSIYTVQNHTKFERELLERYEQTYPGFNQMFTIGYENLYKAQDALVDKGIISFDLTHVLETENRREMEDIFIDEVHINHAGNALVVEAMFGLIQQVLPAPTQAIQ